LLGILLGFLILGRLPFQTETEIVLADLTWIDKNDLSLTLMHFTRHALIKDPQKRPSLFVLSTHPWLTL
jgi:serine/threonine protein kinase